MEMPHIWLAVLLTCIRRSLTVTLSIPRQPLLTLKNMTKQASYGLPFISPSKWSKINGAPGVPTAAWWEWGWHFFQPHSPWSLVTAMHPQEYSPQGRSSTADNGQLPLLETVRTRQVAAVQGCSRSVLNLVFALKQRQKIRTQWGQHNLYLPCDNYIVVPAGSILVIPQNGAGSLGLQSQKLRSFCVTHTSG